MLCDVCRRDIEVAFLLLCKSENEGIPGDEPQITDLTYTEGYGRDWLSFCTSVSSGCHVCSMLCARLTRDCSFQKDRKASNPATQLDAIQYRLRDITHCNEFEFFANGRLRMTARIRGSLPSPKSPGKKIYLNCTAKFRITPFADEVDDIKGDLMPNVVKHWMEKCLAGHDECAVVPSAVRKYPQRLLDLGWKDGALIRLVEPTAEQVTGAYVTLSHSWGGEVPEKLTRDTLHRLKDGLPEHCFQKTFREAMEITRRLGVQYLWIDAFCILQDDEDDWQEQVATMDEVYTHLLCTIAAMDSRDPSEGLFRDRLNIHAAPASINISGPQNYAGLYSVYSESAFEQYHDEHLMSRAWNFQERVFANRILSFGSNGLFWECSSSLTYRRSEACPQGAQEPLPGNKHMASELKKCADLDKDNWYGRGHYFVRNWWKEAIKYYTERKLTFSEDRLVALSAIAKTCKHHLESEYLAGLWEQWLANDLCWISSKPGNHSKKYIAPSWSWAAVSESLSDNSWEELDREEHCNPMIELLDREVIPTGNDAAGKILSAWICIIGTPLPVTVDVLQWLSNVDKHPTSKNPLRDTGSKFCSKVKVFWDYISTCREPNSLVYLLPVIECTGDTGRADYLKGLILEHDTKSGDGFYKRIGVFIFNLDGVEWSKFVLWSSTSVNDTEAKRAFRLIPGLKIATISDSGAHAWKRFSEEKFRPQPMTLV